MGTFLVLVGICVVAAFAKKESDCYNVSELVSLYGEPLFIMYMVVMAFLAMGLYLLTKRIEFLFKRYGPSSRKYKRFARVGSILHRLFVVLYPHAASLSVTAASDLVSCAFGRVRSAIRSVRQVHRRAHKDISRRIGPVHDRRHLRHRHLHVRVYLPAGSDR